VGQTAVTLEPVQVPDIPDYPVSSFACSISRRSSAILVHRADHTDASDLHASGVPFRLSVDDIERGLGRRRLRVRE